MNKLIIGLFLVFSSGCICIRSQSRIAQAKSDTECTGQYFFFIIPTGVQCGDTKRSMRLVGNTP